MIDLRIAHTADLEAAERAAARALLYDVFDDMTEADWEHALGGIHALVHDGSDVVGHAALVMRRVIHQGPTKTTASSSCRQPSRLPSTRLAT